MENTLQESNIFASGFSQSKLLASDLLKTENEFPGSPFFNMRGDIDQLLITESALARGMDVKFYRPDIYRVSFKNRHVMFCQTSAMISEVYRFSAQMKHVTKELLSRNEVPVPSGEVFDSYRKALRYFKKIDGPVVVKPVLGSHGRGVTAGIADEKTFEIAWDVAKGKSSDIIVEKHIAGCDIRVNVIGGRAVAACIRIPANVVGNGRNTIRELVDEKNRIRRRNPAHLMMSEYIKRFDLLDNSGTPLTRIPEDGERVWLSSVANVSVGGEGVQLAEHLDPRILQMAERASAAFPGVHHVGVDVIVPEYDRPEDCEPYIIEVNTNSATSAPVFPNYGKEVDLPGLLLDYLFDDARPDRSLQKVESCCASDKGLLSPAREWDYACYDLKSRKRLAGQKTLIRLAANKLNLKCTDISSSVAAIEFAGKHTLFHRSMPDIVPQVARRACTHSDMRTALLEQKGVISSVGSAVEMESQAEKSPSRYRLLVINGSVVAALQRGEKPEQGNEREKDSSSNILFGELSRDVSEQVHEDFARIAVQAVEALFNPFIAGVDIIARDISEPASGQSWLVNDVVCNPALGWHHFPAYGKGRDVASALLLALFPQLDTDKVQLLHLKINVNGNVQGVGYRKWIQKACHQKGILGQVKNTSNGTVEIRAQGTHVALSSLLSQCSVGPDETSAYDVQVDSMPIAHYETFAIM